MCINTDGSEKPLPILSDSRKQLSYNGVSLVYYDGLAHVYKRSIPYLIENELSFYLALHSSGYVPIAKRYDKYTLEIQWLGKSETISEPALFIEHCRKILHIMEGREIRHGDITIYAIIVKANRPYFIDWAESRWAHDPAPDKRPEGDRYWLNKTIQEMTGYEDQIAQ